MADVCLQTGIFLGLLFFTRISGQSLSQQESLLTTSECFGTDRKIQASCQSSEVIAVEKITYGFKLASPSCANDYPNTTSAPAGCCEMEGGDCTVAFNTSNHDFQNACSGKKSCIATGTQNLAGTGTLCDNSAYSSVSSYNTMEYYCIPESRIAEMCTTVSRPQSGSPLYLWSSNYPHGILSTVTSCACSIQSNDCSASITMYVIHRDFVSDGGGACLQSLRVTQSTGTSSILLDCADTNGFTITKTTILSPYIQLNLSNSNINNAGNFWIGFEATISSATLTLECPGTSQDTCSTTAATMTTTTPTTTTTETTTDTPTPGFEWNTKNITLISTGGGLFLIISLMVLYACCSRYGCKRKPRSIDPEKSIRIIPPASPRKSHITDYPELDNSFPFSTQNSNKMNGYAGTFNRDRPEDFESIANTIETETSSMTAENRVMIPRVSTTSQQKPAESPGQLAEEVVDNLSVNRKDESDDKDEIKDEIPGLASTQNDERLPTGPAGPSTVEQISETTKEIKKAKKKKRKKSKVSSVEVDTDIKKTEQDTSEVRETAYVVEGDIEQRKKAKKHKKERKSDKEPIAEVTGEVYIVGEEKAGGTKPKKKKKKKHKHRKSNKEFNRKPDKTDDDDGHTINALAARTPEMMVLPQSMIMTSSSTAPDPPPRSLLY